MTSLRQAWCAALVLAAIAGCNTEETAPVDTTTAVPPASPTVTPPSGGMSAEMQPTPTPTTDPIAPPSGEMKAVPRPDAPAGDAAPKVDAPAGDAPKGDTPQAAAVSLSEEEIAAVKKLPAADQPLALKQLVCPVSGENLGSMDMPIKVEAKGQSFFLCCASCQKAVKSDPDAVLAKLKK